MAMHRVAKYEGMQESKRAMSQELRMILDMQMQGRDAAKTTREA